MKVIFSFILVLCIVMSASFVLSQECGFDYEAAKSKQKAGKSEAEAKGLLSDADMSDADWDTSTEVSEKVRGADLEALESTDLDSAESESDVSAADQDNYDSVLDSLLSKESPAQ